MIGGSSDLQPAASLPHSPSQRSGRQMEGIIIQLGPKVTQTGETLSYPRFRLSMFLQKRPMETYASPDTINNARKQISSLTGRGATKARSIFLSALDGRVIRSAFLQGPHRAELARAQASLVAAGPPVLMSQRDAQLLRRRQSFVMARQQKVSLSPLCALRDKLDRLGATGVSLNDLEAIPGVLTEVRQVCQGIDPFDAERKNSVSSSLCLCAKLYRIGLRIQGGVTLSIIEQSVHEMQELVRMQRMWGACRELPASN